MLQQILMDYFQEGQRIHYRKGEIILRGQEEPGGVHCIENGYVKVYELTDQGDEHLHMIHGPGDFFSVAWALLDRTPDVFYESLSDSTNVRRVPKDEFLQLAKSNADFSFALLKHFADQFFVYADRLNNLQYNNAYQRVAYRLLSLASRFGIRQSNSIIIQAPITHQLIASSVNLARETVSRELEKMERKGLVSAKGHSITITNVNHLIDELGNSGHFH